MAKFFLNKGGQMSKVREAHNYPVITASSFSSASKEIVLNKDWLTTLLPKCHPCHSAAEARLTFLPAHMTFHAVPQPGYPRDRTYRWDTLLAKAGLQTTGSSSASCIVYPLPEIGIPHPASQMFKRWLQLHFFCALLHPHHSSKRFFQNTCRLSGATQLSFYILNRIRYERLNWVAQGEIAREKVHHVWYKLG